MYTQMAREVNGDTITMGELQELVREGKVRMRAFGEQNIFGHDRNFNGDLAAAADALPQIMETGMVRAYQDEIGVFLGPNNPQYIADDTDITGPSDGRVLQ